MSYPPGPQNDPYGQPQGQPGYGYPQGQPQPGYGYPQGQPQPGYDPNAAAYGYPQGGQAPGTIQANNGYINIPYLGTVQLATMGQRFLARLLDGVILGVVYMIVMFAGVAGMLGLAGSDPVECNVDPVTGMTNCTGGEAALGGVAAFFVVIAIMSVLLLVYEWLMISLKGATLGKMALGLKVVKEADGQVPGLGAGFIRYIIPVVGSFLCGIGQILVYLSPFFDNSGKLQGWHDRAAGTVVIKK